MKLPDVFPRSVDFIPLLTLQKRFKPEERYLFFSGTVSSTEEVKKQIDTKTGLGGKLIKDRNTVGVFKYRVGVDTSLEEEPFTVKDMIQDLSDAGMGGISESEIVSQKSRGISEPEVVTHERMIVQKNPETDLEILEPLNTAEKVNIVSEKFWLQPWRDKEETWNSSLESEAELAETWTNVREPVVKKYITETPRSVINANYDYGQLRGAIKS